MKKCLMMALFCCISSIVLANYSGGSGAVADPYQIATKADLLVLSTNTSDYGKHFILTADIDLAGEVFDRAVIAWDTNGSDTEFQGSAFAGVLDGCGHIISNLTIRAGSGFDYLGLFGCVSGSDALIKRVGMENISINGLSGSYCAGGLCAFNDLSTISQCYVTGSISNIGYRAGGVCGFNVEGTISDCYLPTGSVSGDGYVGGICGYNSYGELTNCYMAGQISSSWFLVGGICGYNDRGWATNCYYYSWSGPNTGFAKALTLMELNSSVSFVGFDFQEDSTDGTNEIWAVSADRMPGLSWQNGHGPLLPVFGAPATHLAGEGTPEQPFEINTLGDFHEFRTNANLNCGCYVLNADIDLGGFTFGSSVINRQFGGYFDGNGKTIRNASLGVEGGYVVCVGLFSVVSAAIENLKVENIAINYVYPTSVSYVGGLCGYNYYGRVNYCSVSGEINGDSFVGGVCGMIVNGSSEFSLFSGNVEGNQGVGGFCGYNFGNICNSYAVGSVSGNMNNGGFCGVNQQHLIENCYSACEVNGGGGGFCGINDEGVIGNSFWDVQSSERSTSSGGIGKTTADMKNRDTFIAAGWDFAGESINGRDDYWYMNGYPDLTFNASDPYENNNYLESAYAGLDEGVQLSAISGMGIQFDDDWYRIQAVAADSLRFQIECAFNHNLGDINIALYNEDGDFLVSSLSSTDNEYIDYIVASPGFYYIKVFSENSCNHYDLCWFDWKQNVPIVKVVFQPGLHGSIPLANSNENYVVLVNVGDDTPDAPALEPEEGLFFTGWKPELPETINGEFVTSAQYTNVLISISISGGSAVYENESVSYKCTAFYSDGSSADVTVSTVWEQNNPMLIIDEVGVLIVPPLQFLESTYITATYSERGVTKTTLLLVQLRTLPFAPYPYYESFETGFGCFVLSGDGGHWSLNNGMTPSDWTGPSSASTGESYTYTEADDAEYPNEEFGMKVRVNLSSAINPFMRFDYHMYGAGVGSLAVDVYDGVWHSDIWHVSGEQQFSEEGVWIKGIVDLSPFIGCESLTIRIRGVVGNSSLSDIAVDNIRISDLFSGGSGSNTDPYLLDCEQDFFDFVESPGIYDRHYSLLTDINLAGMIFSNAVIAPDLRPLTYGYSGVQFTGSFDGNGYVIRNLTINTAGAGSDYLGLFGYIKGTNSCVRNIRLSNASVIGGTGSDFIGILCGFSEYGIISTVQVDGSVRGRDYVGGLVGYNSADIENCCSEVSITAENNIGGLSGWNTYGYIADSCARGSVTGSSNVGGFVGRDNQGAFSNCYAAATLAGITSMGGFCGYTNSGVFNACFWDEELSGTVVSVGGTGKTTEEMQAETTFADAGWDFANTWSMLDYPMLQVFTNKTYFSLSAIEISGPLHVDEENNYAYTCIVSYSDGSTADVSLVVDWSENSVYADITPDGILSVFSLDSTQSVEITAAYEEGVVSLTNTLVVTIYDVTNPYSGGSGTEADPYQIANIADLFYLRYHSNHYSKYFIMTSDIDLAGEVFTDAVIARDTDKVSSGFQGTKFTGRFDGNGFAISNLMISATDNSGSYLGLFGYLQGQNYIGVMAIKNLELKNVSIHGEHYIGSFFGYGDGISVTNCSASGVMSGKDNVGGFFGYGNFSHVYSSSTDCSVTGRTNVGGVCGWLNTYSSLDSCGAKGMVIGIETVGGLCGEVSYSNVNDSFAEGDVEGDSKVGGFCGFAACSVDIEGCYASGGVSGNTYVGGFLGDGYYADVYNCYSTGNVVGSSYVGGFAGTFTWSHAGECYSTGFADGTDQYIGGFYGYYNSSTTRNCFFYMWAGLKSYGAMPLSFEALVDRNKFVGFNFDSIWDISVGNMPKLQWQISDGPTPPAYRGVATALRGTGEENDPFVIADQTDFNEFCNNEQLNRGYYKLVTDLDLSGIVYSKPPVFRDFGGFFDGGGCAIRGLCIEALWPGLSHVGLFHRLLGPVVNLRLEGVNVDGATVEFVGGLCGELLNAKIEDCMVTGIVMAQVAITGGIAGSVGDGCQLVHCDFSGDVTGGDYVGGLTGLIGDNCTVDGCRITGGVDGETYVGGLTGLIGDNSRVNCCEAVGSVVGESYVGGFCGYLGKDSAVINCRASCNVQGSMYVGGFSGYVNRRTDVSYSYVAGNISGDDYVGGFVGKSYSISSWAPVYVACFWDTELSELDDSAGGTGKTTAEMQTQSTFTDAGWDFTGETANGTNDIWYMNGYPALSGFIAPTPDFLVITGPSTVDEQRSTAYTCIAYYNDEGSVDITALATWSVDNAHVSITGGVLTAYSIVSNESVTVTASYKGRIGSNVVTVVNSMQPMLYSGSFENGFGIWQLSSISEIPWSQNIGPTPTVNTGPADASDGSMYIYTESSGNYSKTAAIEAAFDFTSVFMPVLSFDYHMYGATMGDLYVDVYDGSWHNGVWTRSGQQHESGSAVWTEASVDLSAYAGTAVIVIRLRGVTGTYYLSDMAIDNISLNDEIAVAVGSFDTWAINESIPEGIRGENATPAEDGIANLLKYACGLPAMQAYSSSNLISIVEGEAGTFSVRYYKAKKSSDVSLEPIWTTSLLSSWSTTNITNVLVNDGTDIEEREASIPLDDSGFIRLRATRIE